MAIKPFNSVAGFSVGEIPANVVLANGDIITGNIQANANITANGNISATYFLGNGSQLTGIDAPSIQNGNSNVKVYANANVEISAYGNANVVTITGTGLIVLGTVSASGNAIVGNLSTAGNVSSGNLVTTGLISAIGNANVGNIGATAGIFTTIGGTLTTNAQPNITSVGALASLSVIGNANIGNIGSAGVITAVGNIGAGNISTTGLLTVAGNANIGNIGSAGIITASGNVTGANITTAGIVSATGNGTFGNVATAGNIISSNTTINLELSGNTANFIGNVYASNFIGNISGNIIIPGANTGVVYNDGGNANSSTAFTFDKISNAVTVTGNITAANLVTGGVVTATGNITGANVLTGGIVSATGNITGANIITSGIVSATGNISGGNLSITGTSTLSNIVGANITTASNANLNIEPDGTGLVVIANTAGGAIAIAMGDPTLGNLVSNAVTLSNSSSVSNAIAQLNLVLGKLVPPAPPNFPASQSISIQTLSTYRMANYVQTDNTPGANKSVAGGTTVTSVRRASSYSTGNITVAGPGDSGTITAQLNGANAGSRTLTANLDGNGTYSNLVIFNNYDYNNANANIAAGFWSVFSTRVAGTITEGWNEVFIADSATSNSNTANWFYDSSAPGTPTFSTLGITPPGAPSYAYSSTVPHYDNTNVFNVTFDVNKLSGNMYPTSDTFVTGTSGGAFGAPTSITYSTAGISTPLAQNLYVSSGNASVATTSTIIAGFGASSTGPNVSVFNSYNTGTQSFTTTLAANTLYKTGTTSSATRIEEANVFVGSTIGSGSGLAFRIANPGSTNTPVFTANAAAFNSQSSTLQTYDSTIVANILKHDQTNYATGYLPAGPNLSAGRTGTQYFTFKIVRTSVSKFDVKWSGNVAGIWVALPGSTIDTTSSANGWLSMSTAYAGAGIPGVNAPGNGSDGCALGGVAPLNSVQTNKSVTATFGTVSSSSTATNEIYVRIALTSGQSVTALSLQTASN
jgi:hypothetical protein